MADDDDLYADLYAEESGANNATYGGQEEDLLGYDDSNASKKEVEEKSTSKSFIPPRPGNTNAPSTSSSFIPAPAGASTARITSVSSGGSFIPNASTTSTNPQSGIQRAPIQTAPMTNTDNGRSDIAETSGMTLMQQNAIRPVLPHEMPDEGKLFVGGLNWDTTDDGLKHYFSQFGKVNHCLIMRDPSTGRSRGFAFLTFEDPKSVNSVMVKEHFLDGKMIDPKRAIPRQENIKTAKCFVGGIPQSATSESFKSFFSQFGPLLDSTLMLDRDTQKPRGYGFVTYENDTVVERLINMENLMMDGKQIEVKRATPRNADGTRRQPNQRTDVNQKRSGNGYGDDANSTSLGTSSMMTNNPMASMMMNPMFNGAFGGGTGGSMNSQSFDPSAMANFFQQQGGAFNPMMFQQMMMASGMGGNAGWMNNAGAGMAGMGMGGMGMGMGGMSGMGMGMGGMGGGGGGGSVSGNTGGGNKAGSASRSVSASGDQEGHQNQDRNSRDRSEMRGRPLNAPPTSAGLPSRPDANSTSSGRDYQRERSPERRESSAGAGSGRNAREDRW